jgi:hypothetical protein
MLLPPSRLKCVDSGKASVIQAGRFLVRSKEEELDMSEES